jgi:hypothetical protein
LGKIADALNFKIVIKLQPKKEATAPMERSSDVVVIILRFLFGIILAGILAFAFIVWVGIPLKVLGIFVLIIGILSAFIGDKFLNWFMSIFKFLK